MTLDRYSHVSASMQREAAEGAPESASDQEVTTG